MIDLMESVFDVRLIEWRHCSDRCNNPILDDSRYNAANVILTGEFL